MPVEPTKTDVCAAAKADIDAYRKSVEEYAVAREAYDTKRYQLAPPDGNPRPPVQVVDAGLDELGRKERAAMGKMLDAYREVPMGCRGALEPPYGQSR
jgi:hypothetical protein